jgi:hypothetical protein
MKTKYTTEQVLGARRYWAHATPIDLLISWRWYTVGKGRGMYSSVGPETSLADFLVESATQAEFERANDI